MAGRAGAWALALALALPGCAALREMDHLDRYFEPQPPPPAGKPPPPAGPVARPAPEEQPAPPPPASPAAVPAPAPETPEARTRRLLRQQPWLARFWGELTPAQRSRLARRLPGAEPAATWDAMGLDDRVRLAFPG